MSIKSNLAAKDQIENYYLSQPEPLKGYLLALRTWVMNFDASISEEWKWGTPYFYYQKKPLVYIWINKKTGQPYMGISKTHLFDHPALILGNRKFIKILPLNLEQDIPIDTIAEILTKAKKYYT